jgi:hypothetical protein
MSNTVGEGFVEKLLFFLLVCRLLLLTLTIRYLCKS